MATFLILVNSQLKKGWKICILIFDLIKIKKFKQKMYKTSWKCSEAANSQFSTTCSKEQGCSDSLPRQILEFIARQVRLLKEISLTCHNTHPDIIAKRLSESSHLIQKRVSFWLDNNPEQYHDYIQDFYQDQLNQLRLQLNEEKLRCTRLQKQLADAKSYQQLILKQKKGNAMGQVQITRGNNSLIQETIKSISENQQIRKLQKQLQICEVVIKQNSQLIEEQNRYIEETEQIIRKNENENKQIIAKNQQRVAKLQKKLNKNLVESMQIITELEKGHRVYQSQLKQLAFLKIKTMEQYSVLQRELEIKVEEIQLLSKKLVQYQVHLAKSEQVNIGRDRLIEDLQDQVAKLSIEVNLKGSKEGHFNRVYQQRNEQIEEMQRKIDQLTTENQKKGKKIVNLSKECGRLQQQIQELSRTHQLLKEQERVRKIEIQKVQNKLDQFEQMKKKWNKEKQKAEKDMKSLQIKFQELQRKSKEEKQTVKKSIMAEINQLVQLVQQKEKQANQYKQEKQYLRKQFQKQSMKRREKENNYDKMADIVSQIQNKIDFLQRENQQLQQSKQIFEQQIEKRNEQIEELQRSYKIIQQENNELRTQLQKQTFQEKQGIIKTDFTETKIRAGQERQTNQSFDLITSKTQIQKEAEQVKQYKQILSKKDFTIKQLESKIKILQEELRESYKLYEGEKVKMNVKIRELQQLLRERYDISSRFSKSEHTNQANRLLI